MKDSFTGYDPRLKDRARELRRGMTRQEKHLWYDFLRDYPVKVYRQRSIDRFIVDFYCSRAHLVIELDGSQHFTPERQEYDRERSRILRQYGLEIIRFSNFEVDCKFRDVCARIDYKIKVGLAKWED